MVVYTFVYSWVKSNLIEPCFSIKTVYWIWLFSPILVLGTFSVGIGYYLSGLHDKRLRLGYEFLPTDIQWTTFRQIQFTFTSVLAGFAAGLLGIGGGMVLGPLFVEIGMQPQVSAASCVYMLFWTGFSAVVQYYLEGAFAWQWLVLFGCTGMISGQIGQRVVYFAMRKTRRPSLLVFLLGAIIVVAVLLLSISEGITLSQTWTTTSEMFAVDLTWTRC